MTASHDDADPVTERVHDASWSVNLETPAHADDPDRVVEEAIEAVEHTTPGHHVNLVTHGDHGHPEAYLYDDLRAAVDGIRLEYVGQCGCGGHVTRAHLLDE